MSEVAILYSSSLNSHKIVSKIHTSSLAHESQSFIHQVLIPMAGEIHIRDGATLTGRNPLFIKS